ncbi:hypothetical protein VTJ49DRAFT_5324 [Mycothermus thermophilus]|uniref:Uncharacterized protein n=1 Tax=Humicola insolens TaxID=85995 RepID=A0ABR3V3J6_HUMIN
MGPAALEVKGPFHVFGICYLALSQHHGSGTRRFLPCQDLHSALPAMLDLVGFIALSVLGSIVTVVLTLGKRSQDLPSFKSRALSPASWQWSKVSSLWHGSGDATNHEPNSRQLLGEIQDLAECHETAGLLTDLIRKDGAGEWPPRSNHAHTTWPAPLRAYRGIYEEMLPLLAVAKPSLDDDVNRERIAAFRARFGELLSQRVDLPAVEKLLQAAEAVRVAQLERIVPLPHELTLPWTYQQRHFSLTSDSGNNMSNLVLNFTPSASYSLRINDPAAQSATITRSEEAFARIFYDVEALGLPVYHAVIHAIRARCRGDTVACLHHVRRITRHLRPLLRSYYDRVHDDAIARSAWLSHVQGFYGWGAGYEKVVEEEEEEPQWVKFDGLSGNQVLLFQVLDAFLGLPPYLDEETQRRNVPVMQREFVKAVGKHSFRRGLEKKEGVEGMILEEMGEILKRLRLFRTAHRTRAKVYLTQPAPERLPMTAGKSLLKSDMDTSLEYLDEFMLGRLAQTV